MSNQSNGSLMNKIKRVAQKLGTSTIYAILLLYYTLSKKNIPLWVRSTILGSLGYFVFPVDLIPDFIPAAGYTDDVGVIIAALVTLAAYIDDETKFKAQNKLNQWFPGYNKSSISEIDIKLNKKKK